jgi:hypothetical protein
VAAQKVAGEYPGLVYAARLQQDGSTLVLRKSANSIEHYSTDGSLQRTYVTDRDLPLLVEATCDFTTDSSGNVHALVLSNTGKSFRAHLVKFVQSQPASVVTLNKPLMAMGLEMDEAGNYYLLGFEEGFERQARAGELGAAAFKLIHKFSPEGSFIASFFQPKAEGKVNWEEMRGFLHCLYDNDNFVALPNGDMWFLYTEKKFELRPLERPRFLYKINQAGEVTEVKPTRPQPGYVLMAIHKHNSSALFEWVNQTKIISRLLTSSDGAVQISAELPGKILDLRTQTVLLSSFYPNSGQQKLTTWPLLLF